MYYESGEIVKVGDSVLIENGKTPGIVKEIIETETDMKMWEADESGLIIEAEPFGLVFWPEMDTDPVVFVNRNSNRQSVT